jgi:tyrosyl-tRNA synthetase
LGLAPSHGEARRLIEQGGVKLDDAVLRDPGAELDLSALRGAVLQVGKRKFLRLS